MNQRTLVTLDANEATASVAYRTNEIAINWNGALIYTLASQLPAEPR